MLKNIATIFSLAFFSISICLAQTPGQILEKSGVRGGLVVHLGCNDGMQTIEFRADERYLVHGLDTNPRGVDRIRRQIVAKGHYGAVSVDTFDGVHLPYIDNLVNLLVAGDLGDVLMDEVMRVLCPRGVAYIRQDGQWSKIVKPRPDQIDEWTHYMHGPDNNAAARDTVIDSPGRLQWNGGSKKAHSHSLR